MESKVDPLGHAVVVSCEMQCYNFCGFSMLYATYMSNQGLPSTFDVTLVHRPTHNDIMREVFFKRLYFFQLFLSEMSEMSLWLPLFCTGTIELDEGNIYKMSYS